MRGARRLHPADTLLEEDTITRRRQTPHAATAAAATVLLNSSHALRYLQPTHPVCLLFTICVRHGVSRRFDSTQV